MSNTLAIDYTQWERGKDYPDFFDDVALSTISKGYLLPGETPRKAYKRVAHSVASRLNRPDLENKFFKYIWNGWIGLGFSCSQ
jgi:ribonucleoside-diphosphate reductase alpha chain